MCLDIAISYQKAIFMNKRGATVILNLGPDVVYHCKMLQDCWLECRAAIGCAAPSCLPVRMFEDVYHFSFHFHLFPFLFIHFLYHIAGTLQRLPSFPFRYIQKRIWIL